MKHSHSWQIELGTPVHLPFDQLQPIDLSLKLAVAPREAQGVLQAA
jgi:hypothetical protein